MSDPVTNSQVEDVLSSIRRLVGNNKYDAAPNTRLQEPEKLVLTPQLRVAHPEVLRLEEKDAVKTIDDWHEYEEPPLVEGQYSFATDTGDDIIEAEVNEDEVALDMHLSVGFAPLNASDVGSIDHADDADTELAANFRTSRPSSSSDLTAKIAALETAIARTTDQWEPDGDDDDEYAGTRSPTLRWQENVDLDGKGSPLLIKPVPPVADGAPWEKNEEQLIDEEVLRDIVAEIVLEELNSDMVAKIVRSELQGDLGARITRNVRKLVRREIQQALSTRDLG